MTQDLLAVEGRALGCTIRVAVAGGSADLLDIAKRAVDVVLLDIDNACSRFRDDSELGQLNQRAGSEITVSPLLGQAIEAALRAAALTDGDVDLTVGSAVRRAGYDVDFQRLAPDGDAIQVIARAVPGWRGVGYTPATRTVRTRAGVEIDLGATAKALAADLAAAAAHDAIEGRAGVLVSLGGDVALKGMPPGGGWVIQVSDDSSAAIDASAERIALHGGAIATSSTTVRRWLRGGVEQHHIIDPRTGEPAQTPWRLASVVAGCCVDANAMSTAAIIRGSRAPAWLESLRLAARLVATGGAVVRTAAWPAPD